MHCICSKRFILLLILFFTFVTPAFHVLGMEKNNVFSKNASPTSNAKWDLENSPKHEIQSHLKGLMRFYRNHIENMNVAQQNKKNKLINSLLNTMDTIGKRVGNTFVTISVFEYLNAYVISTENQKNVSNCAEAFYRFFDEEKILQAFDIKEIFEQACFECKEKFVVAMLQHKKICIRLCRQNSLIGLLFCSIFTNNDLRFKKCLAWLYLKIQKEGEWGIEPEELSLNATIFFYLTSFPATDEKVEMLNALLKNNFFSFLSKTHFFQVKKRIQLFRNSYQKNR